MDKELILLGLLHRGECGGMVAPCFVDDFSEKELRELMSDAICMTCGAVVNNDDLVAEFYNRETKEYVLGKENE